MSVLSRKLKNFKKIQNNVNFYSLFLLTVNTVTEERRARGAERTILRKSLRAGIRKSTHTDLGH